MNLSKSKYCRGVQCKKMLWMEKNMPDKAIEVDDETVLENGNFVHEIAKYLFGEHINIEYNPELSEMVSNTMSTIDSYKNIVITEASFNYKNNFCSVDILKKINNKYELYEVKGSTGVEEVYITDISYQYYILSNLGLNVTKCSIVHLNNGYERHGKLELDKLFEIVDVTDKIRKLQKDVEKNIKEINEYMKQDREPNDDIDIKCFTPYKCPFFKYCSRHIGDNNVFDIYRMDMKKKIQYYKEGKYSFESLVNEIDNENYKRQIEYELYNKEDYVDKDSIKEFLDTLKEPLYFLDFETCQIPIPLYDNLHPYEKIPFQYSLHYIIDGKLYHKEYLAESGKDPRRELAERLVEDIPINSCVLAYNMSFEKGRIERLANLFPDLSDKLYNIHNNIKDLAVPFMKRYYYSKNFKGAYTIKSVLPGLFPDDPSLDYHNLDLVHNGVEAMNVYVKMANMSEDEVKYTRERLLKYCELDTYAMVKIYWKLKEVIESGK